MKKFITIDGNTAVANMAYQLNEMALIYPITPSSPMAENVDSYSAKGVKNIFGRTVSLTEMQSEAGAAGALHGALTGGSLATTFTSSQGLLLMLPNMYKIAGELLPCTIHVAARTVATHALSIFGDHSDVMSARATGFCMLASSSVQEAQDMALISQIASLKSSLPFLHFFDGFRTSHEINTIEAIDQETIKALAPYEAIANFKARALTPSNPTQRGTAQNEDVYFQAREASNSFYNAVPKIVDQTFKDFYKLTGRKYSDFEYYGAKDAEMVVIAMGSGADTVIKLTEYLAKQGKKVGAIKVRLYRPFNSKSLVSKLPASVQIISVLDRTKESGASFEPLALDVISALAENNRNIPVIGGRYGLSSKEFTPSHVLAVFENMLKKSPINHFTVGINDDVNHTSLPIKTHINLDTNAISCKFYGLGSDGTVSANKNTVKIIGEEANLNGQAYFVYDSKKSGSVTTSHVRLSKNKINAPYLVDESDFIACHHKSFLEKIDVLKGIKQGGTFLLNAQWSDSELEQNLPASVKKTIASKNLKFYVIDAESLASKVGLNRRINVIMQTAFFALAGILPIKEAITYIKQAAKKSYASKGEHVLQMNMAAIDGALNELREIKYPAGWKNAKNPSIGQNPISSTYYNEYIKPILSLNGDSLKVSAFNPTGEVPTGTSQFEKRNVATALPCWISENCIQCNQCALVCPHACIRPYLVKSGSKESKEVGAIPALGVAGYDFKIQLSPRDCTGCGNCAHVCPSRNKALEMVEPEKILAEEDRKYDILKDVENIETIFKKETIKGSQFQKPLFEFSGACAGCGETPYIKLLTQLYGTKLVIANATGCSSIYGGSSPTCPYTKDSSGHGPAWANSLFEDNAEFGLGIKNALDKNREALNDEIVKALQNKKISLKLRNNLKLWLEMKDKDKKLGETIRSQIFSEVKTNPCLELINLYSLHASLFDSSVWIVGGDGWAYDIGFGGLDHVLHSNKKIRVLILDTEVYSNTGGQASKATPMGAVAKFAEGGKQTHKKDIGSIFMNYPNIYVASVALGANMQQTITALKEAEEFDGPSVVIAYCPCINHGTDMSTTNEQQKLAVQSGYWNLYRFSSSNGLTLDQAEPTASYQEFLKKQSRYFTLTKSKPEVAARLFTSAENYAVNRLKRYMKSSLK